MVNPTRLRAGLSFRSVAELFRIAAPCWQFPHDHPIVAFEVNEDGWRAANRRHLCRERRPAALSIAWPLGDGSVSGCGVSTASYTRRTEMTDRDPAEGPRSAPGLAARRRDSRPGAGPGTVVGGTYSWLCAN